MYDRKKFRSAQNVTDVSFFCSAPIYPLRYFALTWHADVGHIMHMAPHIAYIIHLICHQLSLDLLCVDATCLVSISYFHHS